MLIFVTEGECFVALVAVVGVDNDDDVGVVVVTYLGRSITVFVFGELKSNDNRDL